MQKNKKTFILKINLSCRFATMHCMSMLIQWCLPYSKEIKVFETGLISWMLRKRSSASLLNRVSAPPIVRSIKLFNLRSILVRTTSCQVHPATCTRLWKAFFGIAWVLYQLGSLHNARKSTSAMSNFEKKEPKIFYYHPKKIPQNHKSKSKFKPYQSIHSYYMQKKSLQILGWICKKYNRYLIFFFSYSYPLPPPAFFYYLLLHKSVLQECLNKI